MPGLAHDATVRPFESLLVGRRVVAPVVDISRFDPGQAWPGLFERMGSPIRHGGRTLRGVGYSRRFRVGEVAFLVRITSIR